MFTSDYWVVASATPTIVVNGCRLHLEHYARVIAARRLMQHNQQEGV